MSKSKINWTGQLWPIIVGCDKISEGCKNCCSLRDVWRFSHNPLVMDRFSGAAAQSPNGLVSWTGQVLLHEQALEIPLKTKTPTTWFIDYYGDLFHPEVPFSFIHKVWAVMALCPQHTFQVLTKRPARMLEYFNRYENGLGDTWELEEAAIEFNHLLYDKNTHQPLASLKAAFPMQTMRRIGKKAAGRLLRGLEYNEMPINLRCTTPPSGVGHL